MIKVLLFHQARDKRQAWIVRGKKAKYWKQ